MRKIKTLIVDDEPLARARIRKLLEGHDDTVVVGECKNGKEALRMIPDYKPDLVFLDIQMPDFTGFDVLSRSGVTNLPFIIFVTAFDQYALKAFDVHAVDYLLKPYDNERCNQALDHARQQIALKDQASLHKQMVDLLEAFSVKSAAAPLTIEVREKGRTLRFSVLDVYFMESRGNYVKLNLADQSFLLRQTLQSLESSLTGLPFLRIHRSVIINQNYLENCKYTGNNQYQFTLKNGRQLVSGRSFREEIENYLSDSGR